MTGIVHLGIVAHLRGDPFRSASALEIIEDGALWVDGTGRIVKTGPRAAILAEADAIERVNHGSAWLLPGLVDAHVHFPQFYATASYGRDLLDWLERSIFPAEIALADEVLATEVAERFVARLLAAGTATAMVFGSQFLPANLALFEAAESAGLRLIAGMTMMDRGGPEALLKSPGEAREQCLALLDYCRGRPRLHYAITPRFALSCSEAMLELCGDLLREYPEAYLQTHINESQGELDAVARLFPQEADYLAVYERFGLVTPRTVLAHDIHVSDGQLARMAHAGCAVCHCPSSNFYLGSGLFPLARHLRHRIPVALGTDIGAGTHGSIWREAGESYKVQQLQGLTLDAAQLLYLATLGGAAALRLDHETGNFAPGKSADLFVLDPGASPYLSERLRRCECLEDQLFCLLHLAGEAEVAASWVGGVRACGRV
ncbi:guanine deaminase [Methylococcus sp. EFPC2]|uniref:guanine deaminase n=1 Tax=Methylococcus sp. EFPC2 TaxID=2812648 RepID=UPI001968527F|nr:guanine deaminase [Methylococcus sp. EFPC2]QSA95848.1 guanine deaminase [Methylococcus sp. EFPC2]